MKQWEYFLVRKNDVAICLGSGANVSRIFRNVFSSEARLRRDAARRSGGRQDFAKEIRGLS